MFRGNLQFLFVVMVMCAGSPSLGATDANQDCIQAADYKVIAGHFQQFAPFIKETESVCAADLGEKGPQWLAVLKSLVALKNSQALEPDHDPSDALTFKAITERDWWAYFVARANTIEIPPQCPPGAAAYVVPFAMNGTVYLCEPFFEANTFSQASIMMHEVRHFDGHGHQTCTRGLDKGNRGACDPTILGGGSYAISVQTLVALARSPGIADADRLLLESEAIFTAFHRFNEISQVKMIEQMVLADAAGEVFEWSPETGNLSSLGKLEQPAALLNSYDNLTIYPLDPQFPAYRKDRKLAGSIPSAGLFANHYNGESLEQRATYKSISYLGTGGLIKGNELLTLCGQATELLREDLSAYGEIQSLISISEDVGDVDRHSQVLTRSGQMVQVECGGPGNSQVFLTPNSTVMNPALAATVVESFSHRGDQLALLTTGEVVNLIKQGDLFTEPQPISPLQGREWVSLTPMNLPELFN